MAGEYIYSLESLTKQHAGKTILDDINLSFFFGARIGIIGSNGSGKSSLLKIMAGIDGEFIGNCIIAKNKSVGYLAQEPELDNSMTVIDVVKEGIKEKQNMLNRYDEIWELLSSDITNEESEKLTSEVASLQEVIDAENLWEIDRLLEIAMDALRCPAAESNISDLSGGEKRRVALCQLLLTKPDILLLDEPTNHLDAESVAWLERTLADFSGTVVAITHDRYFLDNVAGWILEIDRGNLIPFEGNYSNWLEHKQKRLQQEAREEVSIQKTIANELEWVRQNPKARQSKSQARINAYEALVAESQAREKGPSPQQIVIPSGERLGSNVIELKVYFLLNGFRGIAFDFP